MDKLTMVYFNAERLIKRSWYTIAGIFSLKGQNYTPVMKIKLPAGDLRAITGRCLQTVCSYLLWPGTKMKGVFSVV